MTDIVCCVVNWASDVTVNRCYIPFPWFVKQIMIILCSQTPNTLTQATSHPVSKSRFTQWFVVVQILCSYLLDLANIETVPHTWMSLSSALHLLYICSPLGPICHPPLNGQHIMLHEADTIIANSASCIPEKSLPILVLLVNGLMVHVHKWSDAGVASPLFHCDLNDGRQQRGFHKPVCYCKQKLVLGCKVVNKV